MERSLTAGKPWKSILLFTLPLLAGNLLQQFYNMADAFIVSRALGVEAFTGVSCTNALSYLILGFAQGLTVGLSIPLSQAFGAKDEQKVRAVYAHNLLISVAVGLLLTVLSVLFTGPMLALLRTPQEIYAYAYDYLLVTFAGIMATMLFNFFSNTIRALGDSKTPLIYLFIASGLNILLDLLFILVFRWGVAGAAWATVISQGISAVLCALKIARSYAIIRLKKARPALDKSMLLSSLKIGLPVGFQASIISLGVIFVQFAINGMGTAAIAAYSVSAKIDGIAVEPLRSFGTAMSTYTAQNYGAGKIKRIRRGVFQAAAMSILFSVFAGFMMFAAGRHFTAAFVGYGETEILSLSHSLLKVHGLLYIILALLFIFRFTLQGLGKTFVPTLAGIMELAMRFAAAFLLIPLFDFAGASISTPLSWLGALIPVAISYFIEWRKMKRICEEECTAVKDLEPALTKTLS